MPSSFSDPTAPDVDASRPTHVRHLVVALATLMAILLYLDRICLSFTERYIKEDLRLTNAQTGWLLSIFFWTYALAQVPSGWLSDRYGARRVLAIYILLWSLFTGWMAFVGSLFLLLACRAGCGLAQAGAYPTSAGLLSKWVPFSARAWASGIVSTGGRVGGFAAPVLTAYLMVAFVPPDTDSLLHADDLLDGPGLCRRLEDPDDSPSGRLGATIRDMLPATTEHAIRKCADNDDVNQAGNMAVVLEGLNEVLKRPDLYEGLDLKEFALPSEALRLADLCGEQISERQIERRNRLLLEAAYPDQVRKLYGAGWRPVMVVYGLSGLLVAGLFWLVVRDRPADHPGCNAAEEALVARGHPPGSSSPHGEVQGLPMHHILRSRSLWLSSIAQFGTNFGWVFLLLMLPRYLADVHAVPVIERGWMTSIPILCGMAGMLAGGWLTDRLTEPLGLRWGRCLPMSLTRFLAMAAFVACLFCRSPWPVVVALSVVAVATDLGTSAAWAFMQDIGGRHVGSVLGWGNMWGNIGAALSPVILNWTIEEGGWNACFLACSAAFLLSGVVALGIDATIPLVDKSTGDSI